MIGPITMSLEENSKSYKSLPPVIHCTWASTLPGVVWQGHCLTPDRQRTPIDLSQLSLGEALKAINAQLEYVSFLKLSCYLENQNLQEHIPSLESHFYFRWNDEAKELFQRLQKFPQSFALWSEEKKLKFNDLRPLLRTALSEELFQLLGQLSESKLSKSEGTEIIEALCDLTPEERKSATLNLSKKPFKQWPHILREALYPETTKRDMARQKKVRSWPWPPRMSGDWKRVGDQAGIKLEAFVMTPEDLEKKMVNLQGFLERWKQEDDSTKI